MDCGIVFPPRPCSSPRRFLAPTRAAACSICRCSDPVFNALGEGLYRYGGFQVALDWNRLNQSRGRGTRLRGQIREHADRDVLLLAGERFTVVAQVPYTFNHLTDGRRRRDRGRPRRSGVLPLVRLWSSQFAGPRRRAWISAVVAVKTPWGNNDVSENGERLDEHVQPGTGATNLFRRAHGALSVRRESSIFASAAYTRHGPNDFGYKYGNNVQVNVVYDRKLTEVSTASLELNFLDAKRDQVDAAGVLDPNTGGQSST